MGILFRSSIFLFHFSFSKSKRFLSLSSFHMLRESSHVLLRGRIFLLRSLSFSHYSSDSLTAFVSLPLPLLDLYLPFSPPLFASFSLCLNMCQAQKTIFFESKFYPVSDSRNSELVSKVSLNSLSVFLSPYLCFSHSLLFSNFSKYQVRVGLQKFKRE